MFIFLGAVCVLIILAIIMVASRLLLYLGVFALFIAYCYFLIICAISTGVGIITFAILHEMLGSGKIGLVWAGAMTAGLLTAWQLLILFVNKVWAWGQKFVRKATFNLSTKKMQ